MTEIDAARDTTARDAASAAPRDTEERKRESSLPRSSLTRTLALGLALGAGGVLALAFAVRTAGPRELPQPLLDVRLAFPELVGRNSPVTEQTARTSRFDEALQRPSTPGEEAGREAPAQKAIPVGGNLVAEIPSDHHTWPWSTDGGATLVLYLPSERRPEALIYTESFGVAIEDWPAADLYRFYATLNLEGDGSSPYFGRLWRLLGWGGWTAPSSEGGDLGDRGQFAEALGRRTLGRGIGFTAREEGFSGWRWVGRNEHQVTLRLARWEGSWEGQRPVPAPLSGALDEPARSDRSGGPKALERLPGSLLVASAAEPTELAGTHVAVLCVRTPECPVAEELAAFLSSIRSERQGVRDNLRIDGVPSPFAELAAMAGLELQEPGGPSDVERPTS